jgi:hypothetical protein
MWLFTDCIIYAKCQKSSYVFKKEIQLADVKAIDVSSKLALMVLNNSSNLYFQLEIRGTMTLLFKATSPASKSMWLSSITKAVSRCIIF